MTEATNVRMKGDGSHEAYEWTKGWREATSSEKRSHYQAKGLDADQQRRFVAQAMRDGDTIRKHEQEHER